jgi:hypothetical protein
MRPARAVHRRLTGSPHRDPLPSLYDAYPRASQATRHPRGVRVVALDDVVGTVRHPTQNTADFLPLPQLRGRNWMARWHRIQDATRRLAVLPPVDLLKVGDAYYVLDGHNRVAAARQAGAVAIDADVVELQLPGVATSHDQRRGETSTSMMGSQEVREAASGRQSRTVERRSTTDSLRREELLEDDDS